MTSFLIPPDSLGQSPLSPPVEPMLPTIYRVRQTWKETRDVFTMALEPTQGDQPFPFAPGQFNMLYAFGAGECAISISGDPAKSHTLLHTIRVVGNVTTALSKLRSGDTLGVRGPFGQGWNLQAAEGKDVVFVAGGIGLAPLRPAIYHVLTHRENYGNVVMLIGTRTPQDILFRHDLKKWRSASQAPQGAGLAPQVWVTVDRAESGWHGNVGVVTALIRRASFDPLNTVAMMCGPEIMMQFTVMELIKQGMSLDSIYVTMERNMKCAVGFCGHCQLGPTFICKNGPVFRYDQIKFWFEQREL